MHKDIENESAEYSTQYPEWDTSPNPMVIMSEATGLETKSCAGFQTSPWELEELILTIWECIVILEWQMQKFSARAVTRLLGIDKNTIMPIEDKQVKVSDIANLVYKLDVYYLKDPTILEHIGGTISSTLLGSFSLASFMLKHNRPTTETLTLTPNQQVFASGGLPIYNEYATSSIRLGADSDQFSIPDFMSLCLLLSLSKEGWFHHAMTSVNTFKYCQHLNSIIKLIAYSERVYSKNMSMEYLLHGDRKFSFLRLIERPSGQRAYPGTSSYKYKFTDPMKGIIKNTVDFFLSLELEIGKKVTLESDLVLSTDMIREMINEGLYRDLYILLSHLVGKDEDGNYIINNTSQIKDEQQSRVYSLMTTIKGKSRNILGYINYDISACMQTIVASVVDMSKYPQHQALIDDKRAFRSQIQFELNKTYNQVKEILSAADNGKKYQRYREMSETLDAYIGEAETMVDEFIAYFKEHNITVYQTATSYAKTEWEKEWGIDPKTGKDTLSLIPVGFKKYSEFFFMWTQIEREVRHAMMSCFEGFVHEVHDAVYSKQDIPREVLEQAVLEQTGISVKIEY